MKILIIGANGRIGKEITAELHKKHQIIRAGRNSGDIRVDIASAVSIENIFKQIGRVDACICAAGESYGGNFETMTEENLNIGIRNKLLGQIGQNG